LERKRTFIDFLKIEIGQKIKDKLKLLEYEEKRNTLRKYSINDRTTEVILAKKIPLIIDYYTSWVDNDGMLNIRDDIYGIDKILLEYLKSNMLLQD